MTKISHKLYSHLDFLLNSISFPNQVCKLSFSVKHICKHLFEMPLPQVHTYIEPAHNDSTYWMVSWKACWNTCHHSDFRVAFRDGSDGRQSGFEDGTRMKIVSSG